MKKLRHANSYYFTAFMSGLAVMAAELTASRLLAPYFGNSLYVWTSVIGLFMLALAGGYFFGGRVADARPEPKLYFSLVLAAGAWLVSIPYWAPAVMSASYLAFDDLSQLVVAGSMITVFLVFLAPLFVLGMMVPFTLKLVTADLKEVGRASGRVSMLSTAGSFLGTLLPAFVLVPVLGVSNTFVVLGLSLLLVGSLGLMRAWNFLLCGLAVLLLFFPAEVRAMDDVIYSGESPYGQVFVREVGDERYLYVENLFGVQSVYDPDTPLTEEYYAYFGVLPAMRPEAEQVLILGHAGGSFTRVFNSFFPGLAVTGVEINPVVTEAARVVMDLEDLEVEIIHADARSMLRASPAQADFILVDAYKGTNIPSHLATEEFFALAKSRLTEGGILALNIAASQGEFFDGLLNTALSQFEAGLLVEIPGSFNHMLLVSDGALEMGELPEELAEIRAYVREAGQAVEFDPESPTFIDDKSSQVELLNEEMLMELYGEY